MKNRKQQQRYSWYHGGQRTLHGLALASILAVVLRHGTMWPATTLPRNNNTTRTKPPPALFVFFAGLEGTGHHLWEHLYKSASSLPDMYETRTTLRQRKIHNQLYVLKKLLHGHTPGQDAVFSAPAASTEVQTNGTAIFHELVVALQTMYTLVTDTLLENETRDNVADTIPYPIPLNVATKMMMSYPTSRQSEHAIRYPDLHLLYRACEAASVPCGHVYLYRDPYSVLRSTTVHRDFSPPEAQAKLLSTMLGVLRAQLQDFPQYLISCYDFDGVYDDEKDAPKERYRALLEFLRISPADFGRANPPPNRTTAAAALPQWDGQVFMDTMVDLSASTARLCESLLDQGVGWLGPASTNTTMP